MELTTIVLIIFLALFFGWLLLVLGATWLQIREEGRRAAAAARKRPPESV